MKYEQWQKNPARFLAMTGYTTTLLLCFILIASHLLAQPTNNLVKDAVMPSPNAAALGKYGDIPVSGFTGVPSIGIPIYTVQAGSLSVPVSLTYHASGVKVAETASWVGLGWNLNAGGMITRTVQGLPDEFPNGYYSLNGNISSSNSNHLYQVSRGTMDSEPDIFSYNMNGISGKFYFDKDKVVQIVPKADVTIDEVVELDNFVSFVITTSDGTKYTFGRYNTTTAYEKTTSFPTDQLPSTAVPYYSSWFLLRIETYDNKYFIEFEYAEQAEKYSYQNRASCKMTWIYGSVLNPVTATNTCNVDKFIRTNIDSKRLYKIKSNTATLTFNATTDRTDLDGYSTSETTSSKKRLEEIEINAGGYAASKWKFYYRLFYSYGLKS